MRIKMLETARGSLNGINAQDFVGGEEYDVDDVLAGDFINEGVAEQVYLPDEVAPELKADDPVQEGIDAIYPPENKADEAPEDKEEVLETDEGENPDA